LNLVWHCPSLGLEQKLTFSSPVAIAKFSSQLPFDKKKNKVVKAVLPLRKTYSL